MKAWSLIDFKKVADLLDSYQALQRLANEFQMFDAPNVWFAMGDIREEIRLEVDGKPVVDVKTK